jgi:hypothetical protein
MLKTSVSCIALVVLFALGFVQARAQSDERKFEVGGQFSVLRVPTQTVTITSSAFATSENSDSVYGFGGRFGYNIAKYLTLEAEGNFFPRDRDLEGGRKLQGFFGIKAGKRFQKFGAFAKARPGFVSYKRGDYRFGSGGCVAVFPPPLGCFQPVTRTNFAIDAGGVFEYYPSKRTIVRFDVGDTIVRFKARNIAAIEPPAPGSLAPTRLVVIPVSAETKHNFQSSIGFGFRF